MINRPLHIDGDALLECMMNTKQILERERTSWLRSEIEKLEGEVKDEEWNEDGLSKNKKILGHNQALTSIITRYKEELKVLESK